MRMTGGGAFDPDARPIYFLASQRSLVDDELDRLHPWWLIGANEATGASGRRALDARLEGPATIMLDSGAFALAVDHANRSGVSVSEAFLTPADQLPGYADLLAAYIDIVRTYEARLWGYVEMDVGGVDAKRATRAKLEDAGLRPIPVYHPLTDPWPYLDELLEGYDRLCIGGIARAGTAERRALLGMVWDRRRRFGRDRWVHALGVAPQEALTCFPAESCDAASWLFGFKFGMEGAPGARAMSATMGKFGRDLTYDLAAPKDTATGALGGQRFLVMDARFTRDVWKGHEDDYEREVGSLIPPVVDGEKPIGFDPAG